MRYLRIDVGAWEKGPEPWWVKVLKKIFPTANPELERHYSDAHYWWLEVEDGGVPSREIGFNAEGKAIVLGPVGDNMGFLVESCDNWKDDRSDSKEAAEQFESEWKALWPRFSHLDKKT